MIMCYPPSHAGPFLGIQGPFRKFFINEVSFKDSKIVGPKLPFLWHCQRTTAGPRASKTPAIRDGKEARSCSAHLAQQGKENSPAAVRLQPPAPLTYRELGWPLPITKLTSTARPDSGTDLGPLGIRTEVLICARGVNSSVPKPWQVYE